MKRCVTCRRVQSSVEFNRKRSSPDGLQNVCRECNRARARRYYRENREKHIRGSGKTQNVMYLVHNGYSIERVLTEIAKCDVRCRNCHARVTYERRGQDWRTDFMARRLGY